MKVKLLLLPVLFASACATQTPVDNKSQTTSQKVATSNSAEVTCWNGEVIDDVNLCPPISDQRFCWDGSRPAQGICPQMPSVTMAPKPIDAKPRPGPENPEVIGYVWCFDGTGLTYNAYMAGGRCLPIPDPERELN